MYDACDTKAIWMERENLQYIQTNKLPKQTALEWAREFFSVVSLRHVFKELISGFSFLYASRRTWNSKDDERTTQLVINELLNLQISFSFSSSRFFFVLSLCSMKVPERWNKRSSIGNMSHYESKDFVRSLQTLPHREDVANFFNQWETELFVSQHAIKLIHSIITGNVS